MKNILLVEDDPFIIDIYGSHLKKQGYGVWVANSGQMALDRLKTDTPDLVVLDINLPKMSGWEVLKAMRQEPKTKDLKVVVLSNNNPQECADEIQTLGVIRYFLKIENTVEDVAKVVGEILK